LLNTQGSPLRAQPWAGICKRLPRFDLADFIAPVLRTRKTCRWSRELRPESFKLTPYLAGLAPDSAERAPYFAEPVSDFLEPPL